MNLKFETSMRIKKPLNEVFDAVYNPKKLSGYFTTAGASASLDEGETVMWEFHDFPGAFPVYVKNVKKDSSISFEWDISSGDYRTLVEFTFKSVEPSKTEVKVKESGWRDDSKGLEDSFLKCQGWSQMLCALKAYLEYGINLRDGAYK